MRKNKNFKKLIILAITAVMCLSAISIVGNAAYVELGNPASTSYESYVPFYGFYDYSWSAVIYLQSELGGAKDINGLTYDVYFQQLYTIYDQKVWMKHTTDTDWVGNYAKPDPVADGYTLVFEGDLTFTGARFTDLISLDTDFSYDGTSNLIIYWENWDGDYASYQPRWYYPGSTYAPNRVKYRYADGSMPGDATSASYYFPNIRIHFPTDHDVAVKDIVMPETVEGYGNIPVHVAVKNVGLNTETFPVNVKINAPPATILEEGFEDTYGVRPNPPAGWLVKDVNLDGYFSGVYAYDMWGSYYSSSYAHTGTMSMRMDYKGAAGDDDWLFTPGVALTAGVSYTLDWWDRMSSSSTSYDNLLEVAIGTTQDDTGMTTTLWSDPAPVHTTHRLDTVTFTVPSTGTYYIGFWKYSSYSYSTLYLDDVHLYVPGSTIYDQTVTMTSLSPGSTSEANLPDWVVASPGDYEVIATTLLATDENTMDDMKTQITQVGFIDGSLISIDFPQTLMGPAPFNPVATVNNTGAVDFSSSTAGLIPVHATVLDPLGGTGTVFAEDFEGATSFFEFEDDVSVEFNPNDAYEKYDEFVKSHGIILWPDDEPQFGDPGDWTILNPDNNGAMWHLTDYRSSPASPTHSMYAGDESTKYYLPSSVDILISPKIHVGSAGGSFGFDIYNDVEGAPYDYVVFGASPDGMSWGWWFGSSWWTTWYGYSGIPIGPGDVDANGDCYVAFAFFCDSSIQYEGVYIDNVEVQGSPYLYDETVFVDLAAGAETQAAFPTFTPQTGYTGYYDLDICCEHPDDSVPGNDCGSMSFTCNAPVWNDGTGLGYATIQAAIDDPLTLDGDIIKINDGNFYEDIIINKGVTVSGLHEPDCLTGYSYLFGTVDIVADGVILENLYVHPLEYFNHSQAAIAIYSNNVIVRHNTVEIQGGTDGTIKGIHAYATPSEFTQNIEISDNCVHDVINCGGAGGGGGGDEFFFDFENDDGSWIPDTSVGDWEWTNTYNVANYVASGGYETSQIPPSAAHSGTGMWATNMYGPYSNSASYTTLSRTFDFTGMSDVILSFWSYENVFGDWDYCEVYANGNLEWGPDWDSTSAYWKEILVDLSDYDGMSNVEIEFSMYATSVVAYAGWYLDDVGISSSTARYGDSATVTLLEEDFESGVIPPSGWIHNQVNPYYTWEIGTYDPHGGSYNAVCYYDSTYTGTQDEWLISPSMDLTDYTNTELSFWWMGSYYWGVSPYDNYDLSVYVSTSGSSGPWTMMWTEPTSTWTDWTWYNAIVSLAAYDGESDVRLGFQYYGYDGAEWDIDDILVTGEEGGGPGPSVGYGGAVGIMDQGATWNVDILNNEVYDVHSSGWAYGIEVTPTAIDPETAHFEAYLDFQEDFTGVATGALPTGWTKDPDVTNWGAYPSANAGGVSPEMRFYYSPSATDDFYVMTPEIDTSDFTTLDFSFSHYVSHYTTPYTLKVVALAGGSEYEIDSWQPTATFGPYYESYTLTASEGVGASDFQLAWVFSGYSWNINYWYFDDVVLFGSYDYYETVYPWPLDVNIEENHLYRINLGEGYPCPDEPEYPGVMLTVNYATLPTGGPTPADASEVIAVHNWFDMDCFYPALAILNMDLQHCLMATNNYYSAPDGPGSYPANMTVYDCMTGEPADGGGSQIVNYGPVAFDPWLGLNAVAKIDGVYDDIIYVEVGEAILFDGSESWAKDFTGVFDPMFFWKFGDGFLSMEKTIAHIYTAPGTYHGYLRVHMLGIPEFGIPPLYEWDYFTVIVTSPGAPLSANAGGGSLGHYEVSIGDPVKLTGIASGGTPPYTYSWDLGDGRIVQGQNPTVVYNAEDKDNPESATYTVTLTVIDAEYNTAFDTVTVTVLAPGELVVSINAPLNAALGEYVAFQSEVTGGTTPYSYTWNFGDGITSTQKTPVHIYENAGTYTVTLTVTGSGGQVKTTTHTIEVEGESTADPQIKSVKGIFGIKATIAAGDNDCDWTINVDGKYVLSGGEATGTIPANMEQTVKLPLTFALGKVTVTVTANTMQKQYTAFALGPIFLNLKEA